MPRKPSTVLVMRDYPPFSPRRWYAAEVAGVNVGVRNVAFTLLVDDSADQAGL
ncbi:MAG: hypothetical protein IT450_11065 [Phycisphaerales bacterium]|nr:hypothetical protein [Phycisphaerales bacterium]